MIIGGIEQESTYSDFQPEMDMLNCAFAEVMMEGDAKARAFTFPIPTYNITADFDWNNPKLEMIWQMAGSTGFPIFPILSILICHRKTLYPCAADCVLTKGSCEKGEGDYLVQTR